MDELKPNDIRIDTYSSSAHSGFSLSMARGVRVTHIPTGISITCESERSHHKNKAIAIEKLKGKLSRKKIKVSELEGEQLAEWVARAQELEEYINDVSGDRFYILPCGSHIKVEDYRPDINGGQAMELAKKFKLAIWFYDKGAFGPWHSCPSFYGEIHFIEERYPEEEIQSGETQEIAICRAVVALVYGEYVEILAA